LNVNARKYEIDPQWMALMGASTGGHHASFIGVKHGSPSRVAAVVSLYVELDLVI
jgi:acetyl esterase/lipase